MSTENLYCHKTQPQTMLIGAISDTHDNLPLIEKAIQTLNQQNVELVLHAGDYVAGFVVPKLAQLKCPLIGVFGNNDGDHELLKKRFSQTSNCTLHDRFAAVTCGDYRVALLHGDDTELFDSLVDSGYFNAIVHGHSHMKGIQTKGKTLLVNPGEVCGYLTGKGTLAIIDTARNEAKILEL
ncbi:MAG: metallophosphoesterase [Candidatus Bathyarchaeota archaeon]|nr:metallophosphoesterase [Candidatus Bathyarchaeota archaeon]